jgi:hypothetical protein
VLLLDNSAWSRLVVGKLPAAAAEEVAGWIEAREIVICLPFLLEAGYSARGAADHREMLDQFELLFPRLELSVETEERALRAQRELALRGHHRLAPADLMIAACADEAGAGVLHYDRDYDLIAAHTALAFESVWIAPASSL